MAEPTSDAEALQALLSEVREKEQSGDLAGARALLGTAPAALRGFGSFHYAEGAMAARAGELSASVASFEEAIRREPEVADFRAGLGAALLEQAKAGDGAALDKATAVLLECVAMGPRLPNAYSNLGMAKLLAKDPAGALESFDRALRLDPKDVTALYNRAAALNQLGRLEECLAALDAVLAVDPQFPPALASRKNTQAKLKRAAPH